jgi:hypothetical protein
VAVAEGTLNAEYNGKYLAFSERTKHYKLSLLVDFHNVYAIGVGDGGADYMVSGPGNRPS